MSKKKLHSLSFFFTFILLFSLTVIPAFAALQSSPVSQIPFQLRDSYSTDLFTGSANYSYPIKVPKGTNDLAPNVSLSYSSSANRDFTGPQGAGWDLNRDYIERDVNFTPDNTSDDKFKLRFQGSMHELIYVSGNGRYHTKIESNLHITKLTSGASNDSGEYWQVITPDGKKYRFGQASNSELMCNGRSYVLRWQLDSVEDTHFNKIFYTYSETGGASYLTKIEYNSEKARVIDFSYTNNLASRSLYVQGCNVSDVSRLNDIKININASLVNQFDLNYTPATNSAQMLTSITERVSTSSALPATTFAYKPQIPNWATGSAQWLDSAEVDAHLEKPEVTMADVNGDALPDIVKSEGSGNNTWKVLLNLGDRWQTSYGTPWVNNYGMDARLDRSDTRLIDVNGDALPDIVKMHNNSGTLDYKVYLNTGSSWTTSSVSWVNNSLHGANIASGGDTDIFDVNGDNLPDLVKTQTGDATKWKVFKNTGSGWSTSYDDWTVPSGVDITQDYVRVMDVNGDGLADFAQDYL